MNIQDTLKSAILKGFKTIYNVKVDTVEFQATRKDFNGDITVVVFSFFESC